MTDRPDSSYLASSPNARLLATPQDKLRCAAEHVTYSSVFGGLFQGSSGRLDAVATLVAVLRVRLRHPGVPDHQLMEVRACVWYLPWEMRNVILYQVEELSKHAYCWPMPRHVSVLSQCLPTTGALLFVRLVHPCAHPP